MLTTNSMYNGDSSFYRRSVRGVPMALGQGSSLPETYDQSHLMRRPSATPESDAKTSTSHRKRVPVACERCRKRKIKCSGDEGPGRGCVNCRNAGFQGCQFLRVQSFSTPVNSSAVSSGRSWQISRYHPYSCGTPRAAHRLQNTSMQQTQTPMPYTFWQNGTDFTGFPSTTQGSSWNRSSFSQTYPLTYGGEGSSVYTTPPPSYMLPDPEPTPYTSISYMAPMSRPQHNTMWLEQMSNTPTPQPIIHSVPSSYPRTTEDTQPAYQSIHTNSSELGRTLPDPSISRQLSSLPNGRSDTPPLSAVSHPSSISWQTDTASNVSAASSRTSCSGRHDSTGSFTNPAGNVQGTNYDCSVAPSSPQTIVPKTTSMNGLGTPQSRGSALSNDMLVQNDKKHFHAGSTDGLQRANPNQPIYYGHSNSALQGRRGIPESIARSQITGEVYWPVQRQPRQQYEQKKPDSIDDRNNGELESSVQEHTQASTRPYQHTSPPTNTGTPQDYQQTYR